MILSRQLKIVRLSLGGAVVFASLLFALQDPTQPPTAAKEAPSAEEPPKSEAGSTCLTCHGPIQAALQRKVKHAAVEMGCDSCHVNHRDRKALEGAAEHYLSGKQSEVCGTCHDLTEKPLVEAHRGQPFSTATCTRCHDPHASDQPKLIAQHAHPPFAERQCDSCHQEPKDGKITLTSDSTSAICFDCHPDVQEKLKSAKSKHTLIATDPNSCTDCHDPHASRFPKMLVRQRKALCTTCHAEVGAGKKYVHAPVQQDCTLCHDSHASDSPKNLHAAANDLCLACHGPSASRIVAAKEPVTLFDSKVELAAGAFPDLTYLELSADGKLGHPMSRHPVNAPAAEGREAITCMTCHLPHAANGSRHFLVTEKPSSDQLCVRCHK